MVRGVIKKNQVKPKNFDQNKEVAQQGGHVAGTARKEIEQKTGKSIISPKNAKQLQNSHIKKIN